MTNFRLEYLSDNKHLMTNQHGEENHLQRAECAQNDIQAKMKASDRNKW